MAFAGIYVSEALSKTIRHELKNAQTFTELLCDSDVSVIDYFNTHCVEENCAKFSDSKFIETTETIKKLQQLIDPLKKANEIKPRTIKSHRTGKIYARKGCMGAGKTNWLCEKAKLVKLSNMGHRMKAFMSTRNTREEIITSRSGLTLVCKKVTHLLPEIEGIVLGGYNRIFIDEAHFFADIAPFCLLLTMNFDIHVYLAYLDGTFKQNHFDSMKDLIPHMDEDEKLPGACQMCGHDSDALYSIKKPKDKILGKKRLRSPSLSHEPRSKRKCLPQCVSEIKNELSSSIDLSLSDSNDQTPLIGDIVGLNPTFISVCRSCKIEHMQKDPIAHYHLMKEEYFNGNLSWPKSLLGKPWYDDFHVDC